MHLGPRKKKQLRRWAIQFVLNGIPAVADALQPSMFDFVEDFKAVAESQSGQAYLSAGRAFQAIRHFLPKDLAADVRCALRVRNAVAHPLRGTGELVQRVELALGSQALSGVLHL